MKGKKFASNDRIGEKSREFIVFILELICRSFKPGGHSFLDRSLNDMIGKKMLQVTKMM